MARKGVPNDPNSQWNKVGTGHATWSHQNAYRRRRWLAQTMSRSLLGEQLRAPDSKGRHRCMAQLGNDMGARSGQRCNHQPLAGMDYCRFHGGKAPAAQRLAAIRHSYWKAKDIVAAMVVQTNKRQEGGFMVAPGKTLESYLDRATHKDPREVLLQQVHESAAMAAATREMAGEIDVEALRDPGNEGHAKAKQTHELFQQWNAQALKAAKQALDIGIDEQLVRLAEMQAKAMVMLLRRVLAADILQLSPAQQKMASVLLGQGLRDMVPDLETSGTYILKVDGEELPYNEAMSAVTVGIDIMKEDHRDEVMHAAHKRLNEESRRKPARVEVRT